jgi:UDP-N-acetylglucosamine 2-epimerase
MVRLVDGEDKKRTPSLPKRVYRLFDKKRLNFFIYYPISMNKKTEDMVFQALRSSHKIFFLALFSVAYDSQLFFLMDTCSFLGSV